MGKSSVEKYLFGKGFSIAKSPGMCNYGETMIITGYSLKEMVELSKYVLVPGEIEIADDRIELGGSHPREVLTRIVQIKNIEKFDLTDGWDKQLIYATRVIPIENFEKGLVFRKPLQG